MSNAQEKSLSPPESRVGRTITAIKAGNNSIAGDCTGLVGVRVEDRQVPCFFPPSHSNTIQVTESRYPIIMLRGAKINQSGYIQLARAKWSIFLRLYEVMSDCRVRTSLKERKGETLQNFTEFGLPPSTNRTIEHISTTAEADTTVFNNQP